MEDAYEPTFLQNPLLASRLGSASPPKGGSGPWSSSRGRQASEATIVVEAAGVGPVHQVWSAYENLHGSIIIGRSLNSG